MKLGGRVWTRAAPCLKIRKIEHLCSSTLEENVLSSSSLEQRAAGVPGQPEGDTTGADLTPATKLRHTLRCATSMEFCHNCSCTSAELTQLGSAAPAPT